MRTIFRSLAWKEWHEHKWKLAAILAILCGVALLVATFGVEDRDILPIITGMLALCIIPLAIFLGTGAAAGERSRGTFPFLQSLPVPMWRVAMHKLVAGLLTIACPTILVLTLAYAACSLLIRWELLSPTVLSSHGASLRTGNWVADTGPMLLYGAASFFVWTIAISVNSKDEFTAGAVALAAMVGWGLFVMFIFYMAVDRGLVDRSQFTWFPVVAVSTIPGGLVPLADSPARESRIYFSLALFVAAIVHVSLATRYVRRFGQLSELEIRSPKSVDVRPGQLNWLGPPRRSALSAIAWKQLRETGPVALAGVVGAVAITSASILTDWQLGGRVRVAEIVGEVYPRMAVFVGAFVAVIAGVSVGFSDVAPKINEFWRSRPIQPDTWFWSKYVAGLSVVLVSIYGPIYLLAGANLPVFQGWNSPDAIVIPLGHFAIFASAVAMICVVRQAVYAAILSMAVVYLGVVIAWLAMLAARLIGLVDWPPIEFYEMDEGQVAAGLILSCFTSTLLAWLAVRYDWGKKSRY